jgi:hypothetical protein
MLRASDKHGSDPSWLGGGRIIVVSISDVMSPVHIGNAVFTTSGSYCRENKCPIIFYIEDKLHIIFNTVQVRI